MSVALTFAAVPGLDLVSERKKVDFPVDREAQLSDNNKFISGFKRISVPDPNNSGKFLPIGEVPANRPYLPYGATMDWLLKEFEEVNTPFKLRTSVISKRNYNLYQEYIFDQDVAPPDGEGLAPMVFVRSSYIKGPPLALYLGTYRFVCSNGAIVSTGGKTSISVNSRNWGDLSARGIHDDFRNALDHYSDVSKFYAKLSSVPLADTLSEIFQPKFIPFCMRKKVIGCLEEEGLIQVNLSSDKTDGEKYKAIKEEDFLSPGLVTVNSDISTWDVYNKFTYISSRLSSSDRVLIASKSIDRVFRRLSAVA